MRFIDEAKIKVSGGHGGPGSVSFRRETFIPRGGPDGGDGGAGGSVIFVACAQLGSLQDFRFKRSYQAENGHHGSGANKAGRDGEDITIRVPVGTLIKNTEQEVLIDLSQDEQTWVACKGGRGGKGNAHFVSSTYQAPRFAQPGEEGETLEIILELKLLADAGIIGFPNAGKSTLISRMSAARPKIADYPFTTLTPHLGVVSVGNPDSHTTFIMADIPGLVEGAHTGIGLGHKFLKHVERTRVMVHLLDSTLLLAGGDNLEDLDLTFLADSYRAIRSELKLFSKILANKPEIIVLNKIDALPWTAEELETVRTKIRTALDAVRQAPPTPSEAPSDSLLDLPADASRASDAANDPGLIAPISLAEPYFISAVSGEGVSNLTFSLYHHIQEHKKAAIITHGLTRAPAVKTTSNGKPVLMPDDLRMRT